MRLRIIGSVRRTRTFASLLLLAALAGCTRGAHPGQLAEPEPAFAGRNGPQTIRLSQFRGKVVILNFWATWCAPCIDELPSLQELQKQRPDIQVLAVSIDDDPAAYSAFLKQYDINLLAVRDGSQGANLKFGSVRVPETFVLDRSGGVRRKCIGPQPRKNSERNASRTR